MSLAVGLYVIRNMASGTLLDLDNGSSNNGTKVQGWKQLNFDDPLAYDQLWYIQPVLDTDTYTVWNLKSGTVLELDGGKSANGTKAQGWGRTYDLNDPAIQNQEWEIHRRSDGANRFVNKRAGTALDLSNGNSANGTQVQGWEIQPGNRNQFWYLEHRTTPKGT